LVVIVAPALLPMIVLIAIEVPMKDTLLKLLKVLISGGQVCQAGRDSQKGERAYSPAYLRGVQGG
jgi:hypothetical protein